MLNNLPWRFSAGICGCVSWSFRVKASAPDLNVFAELATMRALAPTVSAGALLDSATRQGARALGFDHDYGTIEPGKSARLLAVTVPPREVINTG